MPAINIWEEHVYFLAMLILGLSSIPMCLILCKHNITPTWLVIWGVIGYAVFSFAFLMEFFCKQWSMYHLILAGFWELTFGKWLIIKGGQKKITTYR
nr:DUF4386 domain-containing protein [uncultured Flavobacterium sp.]